MLCNKLTPKVKNIKKALRRDSSLVSLSLLLLISVFNKREEVVVVVGPCGSRG